MALISAHRAGAGTDFAQETTLEALKAAAASDCHYVEFDVQRCKDGVFVIYHMPFIMHEGNMVWLTDMTFSQFKELAHEYITLEECLEILKGKKKAHVDFKFVSPQELYATPEQTYEVIATKMIADAMGPSEFIITTLEDQSVAAVRKWSKIHNPDLLVGLSLGKYIAHLPKFTQLKIRLSELFPGTRLAKCDANLVVAYKLLAKLNVLRCARRRHMPLLVWTVDEAHELEYWLEKGRAWLVTSNVHDLALKIHDTKLHAAKMLPTRI